MIHPQGVELVAVGAAATEDVPGADEVGTGVVVAGVVVVVGRVVAGVVVVAGTVVDDGGVVGVGTVVDDGGVVGVAGTVVLVG